VRPDEASVASTCDDLGDDVWREVLDVYWPQAASDLEACRAAAAAGDAPSLRATAHGLKGASASVGFASVAQAAAVLERCEAADAPRALAALEAAYAAADAAWRTAPRGAHGIAGPVR
jgi:HPt (histidine-containing phosphotransfer) domain-containing protein